VTPNLSAMRVEVEGKYQKKKAVSETEKKGVDGKAAKRLRKKEEGRLE